MRLGFLTSAAEPATQLSSPTSPCNLAETPDNPWLEWSEAEQRKRDTIPGVPPERKLRLHETKPPMNSTNSHVFKSLFETNGLRNSSRFPFPALECQTRCCSKSRSGRIQRPRIAKPKNLLPCLCETLSKAISTFRARLGRLDRQNEPVDRKSIFQIGIKV